MNLIFYWTSNTAVYMNECQQKNVILWVHSDLVVTMFYLFCMFYEIEGK